MAQGEVFLRVLASLVWWTVEFASLESAHGRLEAEFDSSKDLIAEGIPPEHLVAAGFGQYRPVNAGDTAEACKRNRCIELKLTGR
jgi:hypothetical protein